MFVLNLKDVWERKVCRYVIARICCYKEKSNEAWLLIIYEMKISQPCEVVERP